MYRQLLPSPSLQEHPLFDCKLCQVLIGSLTRMFLILILRWLDVNIPYRILTGTNITTLVVYQDYNKENPISISISTNYLSLTTA